MPAILVIIGWFMVIGGLAFALVFPQLEGAKPTLLFNIILWAIPIAGLYLILFSNKVFGNGK